MKIHTFISRSLQVDVGLYKSAFTIGERSRMSDDNNMFAMMKFDTTITSRIPVSSWIAEIIAIVDRAAQPAICFNKSVGLHAKPFLLGV